MVSTFASGFNDPAAWPSTRPATSTSPTRQRHGEQGDARGRGQHFASGFNDPVGLAFDAAGNLYVANDGDGTVSEVSQTMTVPFTLGGTAGSGTATAASRPAR